MSNKAEIKTRTLNNGNTMPEIALGMWQMADNGSGIVKKAIELGYRHIDTAAFYKNEHMVGEGIKNSGIDRKELFITTKLWPDDMAAGLAERSFESSLKELGLDYIDLYLLHWPLNDIEYSWKYLERLYEQGLVKNIGVSNFTEEDLEKLSTYANVKPVMNQIESNPGFSRDGLVRYCLENDIVPEAWAPLGKGEMLKAPLVEALADKYGKTSAQILIKWDLQRGMTVVAKTSNENRLTPNADVYDFTMEEADVKKLHTLERGYSKRNPAPGYIWK